MGKAILSALLAIFVILLVAAVVAVTYNIPLLLREVLIMAALAGAVGFARGYRR